MHDRLFEAALGIAPPWFVAGVRFDEASKVLTVGIDFAPAAASAWKGLPASTRCTTRWPRPTGT